MAAQPPAHAPEVFAPIEYGACTSKLARDVRLGGGPVPKFIENVHIAMSGIDFDLARGNVADARAGLERLLLENLLVLDKAPKRYREWFDDLSRKLAAPAPLAPAPLVAAPLATSPTTAATAPLAPAPLAPSPAARKGGHGRRADRANWRARSPAGASSGPSAAAP